MGRGRGWAWLVAALLALPGAAGAVGSAGWRELAVQIPDIQLKNGVPATFPVELKTIELDNTLPTDTGLYAITNVPGLTIVSAYAYTPPQTFGLNEYAPIGVAEDFATGTTPWFGHFDGTTSLDILRFAVRFDGSAPNGTQGSIQIAVNEGGDQFFPRVVGTINVYVGPAPRDTWFRVVATNGTITGNRLVLNHPLLNGKPTARLFVAHVTNPAGVAPLLWNHPVSVAYDSRLARWTIQNDDQAAMPRNIAFNVRIDPGAVVALGPDWQGVLCDPHVIDPILEIPFHHPSADNNPYATVLVTPKVPHSKPLAVKYVAPTWRIVYADGSALPFCAAYNVQVLGFSAYFDFNTLSNQAGWLDPFVSNGAGASLQGGDVLFGGTARTLPFWWALGNPDEPIVVTHSLSTPATFNLSPVSDNHFAGLAYNPAGPLPRWQLVHEDGSAVPDDAAFHTWGAPQLTP